MKGYRTSELIVAATVLSIWVLWPVSGPAAAASTAKAHFAGGCFWSMEEAFEKVEGVSGVVSGYMGGTVANPTYEQVSEGQTGHVESIEVDYDPEKVSYQKLVDVFWHMIDPWTPNGQFCDFGKQYRTAIFYGSEDERKWAEESKRAIEQSKGRGPIVTHIAKATPFYAAEEYHQDFYKKSPFRFKSYKIACGRSRQLEVLWGKP